MTAPRHRVALDARSLQGQPIGGVGRAVRATLAALRDEVEFVLLTDARKSPIETDLEQRALRAPGSSSMTAWLQLAVPPALRGFDGVFHGPWYGLPLRQPVPMVVTLHDISFELYPQWFSKKRLVAYRAQARWAVRTAAAILTDASSIRDEVLERYHVSSERVIVAPPVVELDRVDVAPVIRAAAVARVGMGEPYVVAVGGAERRNLAAVLDAWPAIRAAHPELSLVVLGEAHVDASPGGVIVPGHVDDDDWIGCIAGARLLLYPTRYEGFGYPAAEAIVNGVPVVCGHVGSLPEVVGTAGAWLDSLTGPALERAVVALLDDPAALGRLRAAAHVETDRLCDQAPLADATLRAYRLADARRRRH